MRIHLLALLLFGLSGCSSENINYEVAEEGIEITATVHGRTVPKDSLVLESLRIINFSTEEQYQPTLRLWGVGQPAVETGPVSIGEYLEGWFRLQNGELALAFLSEHEQAIYIQTKLRPPRQVRLLSGLGENEVDKHFVLLLGTDEPEALKELMEQQWAFQSAPPQ